MLTSNLAIGRGVNSPIKCCNSKQTLSNSHMGLKVCGLNPHCGICKTWR